MDANMSLVQACKLPGIADLPMKARGKFGKALIAELNGNHEDAERLLNEAVAEEDNFNSTTKK